jgi:hypothetical protein
VDVVEPGIYARGTVDYDAIDAVNYSSLKALARSPKHYRYYLENGSRETRDMFKGTAAHIAILEPERFALEYGVFTGKRRSGKEWEAFKAANAGKATIKADDLLEAMAMRDAVRADALGSAYLSNGRHEVTIVWIDGETGLKMKGRVDWLRNDNVLVDVKTTRDATPFFFARDVARLQYHVQSALYLDGIETLTGQSARFVAVAIEKAPPYDVVTFDMPEPVLGVGRDEYRRLLKLLIQCRQDKSWPGIGNGFEVALTLPPWAMGDENDIEALGLEM